MSELFPSHAYGRDKPSNIFAALCALTFLLRPDTLSAADAEEEFLPGFVVGNYVLVGKEPNDGSPYAGVARIDRAEGGLILQRHIAGKSETIQGTVVKARSGKPMLRFSGPPSDNDEMTCLIQGDLDNYARLTCYVIKAPERTIEPGLEAYFPTAAWPDDAPNKISGGAAKNPADR